MPITKSATKAAKRSLKLRSKNSVIKRNMKDSIKTIVKTKQSNGSVPMDILKTAYSKIDKALKAGILKKNTAARRKSKVARMANS